MIEGGGAAFEDALKLDLPRGLEKQARAVGRDRGLSARWRGADELTGGHWQAEDGILLGYRGGRVVGWRDDRHMLTIAGSRAGKGVSLIIPNLIYYRGSAVVIDPKGENAARTAGRRGKGTKAGGAGLGQDVHVLDPFGESGIPTASFNPLELLDPNSPDVVEDIGLFADALITHPEHGERHWSDSAQALIRALILLVVADVRFRDRRNLITVRGLLNLTDPTIEKEQALFEERFGGGKSKGDNFGTGKMSAERALIKMLDDQTGTPYGYVCIGMAEQLMAMGDKERGSVLSSARTQTQWLDSPKMTAVLENTDFDLADLKRKRATVYLCLPATRMTTHARWLRLVVLLALGAMERVKTKPELPVLFVLDEFPVLGYLQSVEMVAGLMAGFGVKLWPIIQNVGQLKQHYSKSWETFIANSGIVTAFGVSDSESLKVLSECLGRTGVVVKTDSGASRGALMQGASPFHDDRRELPLLAEHELRMAFGRGKDRVLIYNVENEPAVARRFVYFRDPIFAGLYDPDPNYGPRQ